MSVDVFAGLNDVVRIGGFSALAIFGSYIGYKVSKLIPAKQTLEDKLVHLYCVGASGSGKTTYCLNAILNIINAGYGCLFIDVHGQDSRKLLNCIPEEHQDRVVYMDAGDIDHPVGFSVFSENNNVKEKQLSVDYLVSIFGTLWSDSIGAASEDLLRMAALGVVDKPNATLLDVYLILTDADYRKRLKIADPAIRQFWEETFPTTIMKEKARINPILNKLRKLIMSRVARLTLCQEKPKLNIEKAMKGNKIVVCNLSKGEIGLDTANLLAALLVSKVQMVTFKRSADAVPYFLYLDEFQNYVTNSFEMLLSESRKYRVGLNLFHQYMTQIPDSLQHAIVGNVGTFVSFRIPDDTRRMGKVLGWDEDELQKLKNYTYVARRLVKGQPEESLHMKADPPPAVISGGKSIVKASRDEYGVPAWVIDDYIENNIIKKEGENDDRIFGVDDSARQGNVRFLEIYRANGHDFPTEQVVFPSKGKRGVK